MLTGLAIAWSKRVVSTLFSGEATAEGAEMGEDGRCDAELEGRSVEQIDAGRRSYRYMGPTNSPESGARSGPRRAAATDRVRSKRASIELILSSHTARSVVKLKRTGFSGLI